MPARLSTVANRLKCGPPGATGTIGVYRSGAAEPLSVGTRGGCR